MKLCSLFPNSYIHVKVSDLYIPRIGLPIGCGQIGRPMLGIYKSLIDTVPIISIHYLTKEDLTASMEIGERETKGESVSGVGNLVILEHLCFNMHGKSNLRSSLKENKFV
jgi:hypothetical protein